MPENESGTNSSKENRWLLSASVYKRENPDIFPAEVVAVRE
jgi:hypothetical protein